MDRIGLSLPPEVLLPMASGATEARLQRELGQPEELLHHLKALGVQQLELRPVKPGDDPKKVLRIARTVWSSGLSLSVHAVFPEEDGSFSACYPSLLPLLREAPDHQEAVTLTFHALPGKTDADIPAAAGRTVKRLRLYAQEAEAKHFVLAVEENRQKNAHDPCDSCEGVVSLLRQLPEYPSLGACFDFGHFYSNARKNHPEDRAAADALLPPVDFCAKAIHTHIHAYGGGTHYPFLPPNELPLAQYLACLRRAHYTGVYNLELEFPRFPDVSARLAVDASVAALQNALNALCD